MYIGIIQAALNALGLIWNKKIISNTHIGNHFQMLFSKLSHILVLFFLITLGFFNFFIPQVELTLFNLMIVILGTFSLYLTHLLRIIAYRNEKISTLQPFSMLYQVLPPIISFVFISSQESSTITFIASLVASIIIIVSSVNLKTLKINKYSLMVLASSLIKSVQIFYMIYLLTFLNEVTFYLVESIFILIFALFFSFKKKEFSGIKEYTGKYLYTVILGQTIILLSIIISLTMFKNFGVILTSLIGLLYLVFSFLFSYIFLKEIPTKKDVLVTSSVSICIIFGVIFT